MLSAPVHETPISGITKCKSCNADIRFKITRTIDKKTGKPRSGRMPVDAKKITVITPAGETVQMYNPHWATCPTADQHRR